MIQWRQQQPTVNIDNTDTDEMTLDETGTKHSISIQTEAKTMVQAFEPSGLL